MSILTNINILIHSMMIMYPQTLIKKFIVWSWIYFGCFENKDTWLVHHQIDLDSLAVNMVLSALGLMESKLTQSDMSSNLNEYAQDTFVHFSHKECWSKHTHWMSFYFA